MELCSRLDELSLSYNGGKDCLVLLILYLCALSANTTNSGISKANSTSILSQKICSTQQTQSSPQLRSRLRSVYIVPIHPFPQIDAFVTQTSEAYHLDVARYPAPMRTAFEAYLRDHPSVKAVLVGTRRTDPNGGGLTHFDPTDGGWPAFMRIHPVIDWHYAEIWAVSVGHHFLLFSLFPTLIVVVE